MAGLVVKRFRPPVSTALVHGSGPAQLADPSSTNKEKSKRQRLDKNNETEPKDCSSVGVVEVQRVFARIFKGGPKRKEGLLEAQEDEGVEFVPEPLPEPEDKVNCDSSWLSSLLGGNVADDGNSSTAPNKDSAGLTSAKDAASLELGWLGSLSAVTMAKTFVPLSNDKATDPLAHDASLSSVAAEFVGKPLPIPPFWRTEPLGKLQRVHENTRGLLLDRMRRMAKDAKRAAEKRGHVGGIRNRRQDAEFI